MHRLDLNGESNCGSLLDNQRRIADHYAGVTGSLNSMLTL